ncbi:hypothetical protein SAY87_016643 [Trapa incisa]|uniref:Uncharacterized protein n=1 Tax=Trapa incisa TaxID=236973 RepID=A0AAN7L6C6_9MYRT|nr:hypothetical protein SAY87_016643 [Trapa incisa]
MSSLSSSKTNQHGQQTFLHSSQFSLHCYTSRLPSIRGSNIKQMDHRNSLAESYGGDGSVQPAISDLQRLSEAVGSSGTAPTIFDPRTAGSRRETASTLGILESQDAFILLLQYRPSPEKELSLFPLRLAVFEKTATGIGALGFIWATVVLLGGFAITLDKTDFWFITIILVIE